MSAILKENPEIYHKNIEMKLWGKNHWYMLAYIDAVMNDIGFFQIGADKNMRTNETNFSIINGLCEKPKRASHKDFTCSIMNEKESTKLFNGKKVKNHDDWCCVHDMIFEGLFEEQNIFSPGEKLRFSQMGRKITAKLRAHMIKGNPLENFKVENKYL